LPAPDLGGGGGHSGSTPAALRRRQCVDLGTMVSSVEGQSGCDGVVAASTGDVVAAGGCHGLVVGDGSGGVPGANCPVPPCSFKGAGSG
jgi:hypothetical protein